MTKAPLHAPRSDRTVVSLPEPDRWRALVDENRERLQQADFDVQGRRFQALRALARSELARRAATYTNRILQAAGAQGDLAEAGHAAAPWIATGHQPELFHPGVWIKNFAVASLAHQCGGLSLNLVVDNDRVKNLALRIPCGPPESPTVVLVPLDRWRGDIPYEEHTVSDEETFRAFGPRAHTAVKSLGIEPMMGHLWQHAVRASGSLSRLSDRIVAARRTCESELGVRNLELPVSGLCQSEAFLWFLCHIAAHAPEFCAVHNQALAQFREQQGIRDPLRPVPDLVNKGGWWELPFWVWHTGRPGRRPLHVLLEKDSAWFGDGVEWQLRLPLSPDRDACCAVEELKRLVESGRTKIRTRALTTTLFMRLFVSDLFIHGLGGAIYDQITDELMAQFYNVPVPAFITLSATVYLPVPRPQVDREELVRLKQELRACLYNPQRFLTSEQLQDPQVRQLVERKLELIRERPATRRERRMRFVEFRRINQELARLLEERIAYLRKQIHQMERLLEVRRILEYREYPFAVYPADYLADFYREYLASLRAGGSSVSQRQSLSPQGS